MMGDVDRAFFAPLLIALRSRGGHLPYDQCKVLDGIFRITRTGLPRCDPAKAFGFCL